MPKTEAVHTHTVKLLITMHLNAYFDFCSQLSGRCASLLKVYEEFSRALATVGRAKLVLLLQLLQIALKVEVKKDRRKVQGHSLTLHPV